MSDVFIERKNIEKLNLCKSYKTRFAHVYYIYLGSFRYTSHIAMWIIQFIVVLVFSHDVLCEMVISESASFDVIETDERGYAISRRTHNAVMPFAPRDPPSCVLVYSPERSSETLGMPFVARDDATRGRHSFAPLSA